MDSLPVGQIVVLLIFLMLSSFFSASETALTTVNKIRMRSLADNNVKGAKTVLKLIEEPGKMLSAVLIGNNIVNLSASSITTSLAINIFDSGIGIGIATGVLTALILIFCEITPKTMASVKAEKLSLTFGPIISFLTWLFTPIIKVVNFLSGGVMFILGVNPKQKEALITETELRALVDVSHEEGVIESEERQMIENVVDFGDTVAKDVMIPQIDVSFVDADCSYDELLQIFFTEKYTRMPVYKDTKDNVIGIINLKDVFFYDGDKVNFDITKLIRKSYFTYEHKNTADLFIEMKKNSIPMAIVLDEYSATAGILTMEDLVEEIVGEIRDEYDYDEVDLVQQINQQEFIVDGSAKLDDINDVIGLKLESDDYDSIAGHIINLMEHIPSEGESIEKDNVLYKVEKLDKNRVEKIHITLINEPENNVTMV